MSDKVTSPMRVRVILAVEHDFPENVRREIGESLELVGWVPVGESYDCWLCRARLDEAERIERQVRKILEFAAFTAGLQGRLPFALKMGDLAPRSSAVRLGSGGMKTKSVPQRSSGVDFATEKIPNGGIERLAHGPNLPGLTQLKTAF
ncbi:MAG: hypothetical protein M5U25_04145 [Planctomycetota bacterium]|nr:hypothetical protein [Planctomycetota bacterium]